MTEQNTLFDDVPIVDEEAPVIYSKKAIWCFSVLFTTIFGGVLLMQNLKDVGKKKEAYLILLFSILYTAASIAIVNIPEKSTSSLTFLCNGIGGAILSEYFFLKYFPATRKYGKKKIWKPLLISIAITIPFLLAVIYSISMGQPT
jgi:hypothetical protein